MCLRVTQNLEIVFTWSLINYSKSNIHIYVNANGWAAYDSVDLVYLEKRLKSFLPNVKFIKTTVERYGLTGLSAHYVNFTEEQYLKALDSL